MTRIQLESENHKELADRIVVRLSGQSALETNHVLKQLFPTVSTMRLKAISEDFSTKRSHVEVDFLELLGSTEVDYKVFRALSSADVDPLLLMARKFNDPTKFQLTITCNRTPYKEFFDECKEITCESCIEGRLLDFKTKNVLSTAPWELKIDRVEQRRLDLCKSCGNILMKDSKLNLQNERLLYTCSYCGHKGWTKAK
ncbi:MAG: hypothetical protein GPJ54_11375 [Candidatus Heimdallarchaeota archaeon]|nr:hypothetical protein [Candidatus Heimdallarchaeota archaeon]